MGCKYHLCALEGVRLWSNQQVCNGFKAALDDVNSRLQGLITQPEPAGSGVYPALVEQIRASVDPLAFMLHELKELDNLKALGDAPRLDQTPKPDDQTSTINSTPTINSTLPTPTKPTPAAVTKSLSVIQSRVQKVIQQCVRSDREFTMLRHRAVGSLQAITRSTESEHDLELENEMLRQLQTQVFRFTNDETQSIQRYTKKLGSLLVVHECCQCCATEVWSVKNSCDKNSCDKNSCDKNSCDKNSCDKN
ncbi:hypothetical protein GNI_074840 [Gregarina niphandrodes]|uniref:Uncharacterized protein n=1 Tax=Gregarina niphandrodes TaxID=110365 RepID=A0A023B6V8_GRENI|nr:hypothetical protein GNI_074840 [Gregarina niphandrodes]EZG66851.1 hypothetical protein GNI_074840 [Gregarina niphandrodes]|eukprot:XP_011130455.1 hypothetical protein GNI_074840 [Gregarina niphandrodes]